MSQKKVTLQGSRKKEPKNVLTRIEKITEGPLMVLKKALVEKRRVKVLIRSAVQMRSICTGYVILFDRHMNMALSDVEEVYRNPLLAYKHDVRRNKTKKKKKKHQQLMEKPFCSALEDVTDVSSYSKQTPVTSEKMSSTIMEKPETPTSVRLPSEPQDHVTDSQTGSERKHYTTMNLDGQYDTSSDEDLEEHKTIDKDIKSDKEEKDEQSETVSQCSHLASDKRINDRISTKESLEPSKTCSRYLHDSDHKSKFSGSESYQKHGDRSSSHAKGEYTDHSKSIKPREGSRRRTARSKDCSSDYDHAKGHRHSGSASKDRQQKNKVQSSENYKHVPSRTCKESLTSSGDKYSRRELKHSEGRGSTEERNQDIPQYKCDPQWSNESPAEKGLDYFIGKDETHKGESFTKKELPPVVTTTKAAQSSLPSECGRKGPIKRASGTHDKNSTASTTGQSTGKCQNIKSSTFVLTDESAAKETVCSVRNKPNEITEVLKRHINKLFIRGDNVVMVVLEE